MTNRPDYDPRDETPDDTRKHVLEWHRASEWAMNHVDKYGGLIVDNAPNFDRRTLEILCENCETEMRTLRETEKALVAAGLIEEGRKIAADRPRIHEFLIKVYKVWPSLRPEVARPILGASKLLRVLRDLTWATTGGRSSRDWRSGEHRDRYKELRERTDVLEARINLASVRAAAGAPGSEIEALLGDVTCPLSARR